MELTKFQKPDEETSDQFEFLADLNDRVFIENDGVEGIRSIHFDSKEGPYISYKNYSKSATLATGQRYPAKKLLLTPKYDQETRTFTAYTDWSYSPLDNGVVRHEFEIVFDKDF